MKSKLNYVVDWKQAPEWANYWAMDENGMAYWYEDAPYTSHNTWQANAGRLTEDVAYRNTNYTDERIANWGVQYDRRPAVPSIAVPPYNVLISKFLKEYAEALLNEERPALQMRYSAGDKWMDYNDDYPELTNRYEYRLKPDVSSTEYILPDGRKFLVEYDIDGIVDTQMAPNQE